MLTARLRELTLLHSEGSEAYRRILSRLDREPDGIASLDDVPMLPVGLFKSHALRSIPEERVFKVVTSSGTTGAAVSRVYLDAAAAHVQTRALAGIMTHWLGPSRLPMIVVGRALDAHRPADLHRPRRGDHRHGHVRARPLLRARRRHEPRPRWAGGMAGQAPGSPILVFGFTFMVWQHLLQALEPGELDLRNGILIHSGGWKKLTEHAVDSEKFRAELARVTGLSRVHNFYGMAEQIGTVFVECEHGFLHAPNAPTSSSATRGRGRPSTRRGWRRAGAQRAARELSGPLDPDRGPGARRGGRRLPVRPARQGGVDPRPRPEGRAARLQRRRRCCVIVEQLVPSPARSRSTRSCACCGRRRGATPTRSTRRGSSSATRSRARSSAIRARAPSRRCSCSPSGCAGRRSRGWRSGSLRSSRRALRVPRGLAFHVPPSNVDTLFVYSLMASFWSATSTWCACRATGRPSRWRCCARCFGPCSPRQRFAELADELAVVSYGHEPEPTAALSRAADVRLLWGGDETVDRVRAVPSGPGRHDLTFGDRFSFAVLRPGAVLEADDEARATLAERLYNDAYWFDQVGCASPRLLVWVGARRRPRRRARSCSASWRRRRREGLPARSPPWRSRS